MRRSRPILWISIAGVVGVVASACGRGGTSPAAAMAATAKKPNIVFVLTDDLDLTSYTTDAERFPVVHRLLEQQGTTFANAFVTDSLCCPSRASILRGQYVHDHGVQDNLPPNGGFEHWQQLGRDSSTVATWLHSAGYRTALFGKYLNGYPHTVAPTYVPPGWDDWASPSAGNPYAEYNYQLNENGTLHQYGAAPSDYLVDVLAKKSTSFIQQHAGKQPFFLYVAPYVPHQPATPAPRYATAFAARAPRPPSYDQPDVSAEPAYVRDRPLLAPAVQRFDDRLYRRRLQSMLGVEDLLRGVVAALRRTHQLDNTYVVFTSDNGFHLGEHRLPFGKQTPYDTDIHVPLIVRGPGVPAGKTVTGMAREIDLAPTFAAWGHASAPAFVDGTSLASLLGQGKPAASLPRDALVEHYANGDPSSRAARKGPAVDEPDDDTNPPVTGTPAIGPAKALKRLRRGAVAVAIPPYSALRTDRYLYAEYATGERQLFDVVKDPDEVHSLAATAPASLLDRLSTRLAQLAHCAGRVLPALSHTGIVLVVLGTIDPPVRS